MLSNKLHQRLLSTRRFSSNVSSFYDIVVVGGGMVGNAMACAIASSPKLRSQRVLVLESGRPGTLPLVESQNYGIRVSAVNPASVEFFKNLGIWNRLCDYRVQPVSDLYVLDSCSQSRIHFEQLDTSTPIAYIVENDALVGALHDRIGELTSSLSEKDVGQVKIEADCRVESCSLPKDLSQTAKVKLADGKIIETTLLIGADGAHSSVRAVMSTDYVGWEYEQSAVVATLRISSVERDSIAWQRFTPLGPVALLPLSRGIASLVWTTTPSDAARLTIASECDFVAELNHYLLTDSQQSSIANKTLFALDQLLDSVPRLIFGGTSTTRANLRVPIVDGIAGNGQRAAFPLAFGHVRDYIDTRAVLIGDAAHRVHPLAGQGVNLGWSDVRNLTQCLEKAVSEGGDIGSTIYLADYDTHSQRHNVPIMLSVDALKRLYGSEFAPLVLLRSIGLYCVNRLLPLKDFIIHRASN